MARLLQPRVEAEVAFVLGADLATASLDLDAVRAAVDYAVAALEIVDSRIAALGHPDHRHRRRQRLERPVRPRRPRVALDDFEPVDVRCRCTPTARSCPRATAPPASATRCSPCSGSPGPRSELGDPLRAGQVVLSGALGPMHSVTGATSVRPRSRPWAPSA